MPSEDIFRPNTIAAEIWPEYLCDPDSEDTLSERGRNEMAAIITEAFYFVCGVPNFENKHESYNGLLNILPEWERMSYPNYSDIESTIAVIHWIADINSVYQCKIAQILTTTSWDKEKYGPLRSSVDWPTLRRARYCDAMHIYKESQGFLSKDDAKKLQKQIFDEFGYKYMADVLIANTRAYRTLRAGNRTLLYCKEVVEFTYILWLLHEALVPIDAILDYESDEVSEGVWALDQLTDLFYEIDDINAPDIYRGLGIIQESEVIYCEENGSRQYTAFPPEKNEPQKATISKLNLE